MTLALGHASVADAQRHISSREFAEWVAYFSIEPFGEERADLRAAIVACTIANAHRGKRRRPFKVSDFLPKFDGGRKQQTPEEQLAIVELLNAAFGGKDLRSK